MDTFGFAIILVVGFAMLGLLRSALTLGGVKKLSRTQLSQIKDRKGE